MGIAGVLIIGLWLCVAPGPSSQQREPPEKQRSGMSDAVEIQMNNVNFRLAPDIVLEVRNLRGQLQKTKPEVPVTFDDPDSFIVEIASAQVAMVSKSYDCVVIGAGVRLPPRGLALFEVVINAVHKAAPSAAIAFNTFPQDSADAAARWLEVGNRAV